MERLAARAGQPAGAVVPERAALRARPAGGGRGALRAGVRLRPALLLRLRPGAPLPLHLRHVRSPVPPGGAFCRLITSHRWFHFVNKTMDVTMR